MQSSLIQNTTNVKSKKSVCSTTNVVRLKENVRKLVTEEELYQSQPKENHRN